MSKRLTLFLFFVFFLNLSLQSAFGTEQATKRHIRLGFHAALPPSVSGEVVAAQQSFYRLIKEVDVLSEYTFSFHHYGIEEGWKALEQGEIDLFGPVRHKKHSRRGFAYMQTSLGQAHVALVFKDKRNIFYDDPPSIDRKTIATFKSNPYNVYVEKYLQERNITANFIYGTAEDYHRLNADFYLVTSRNKHFDEHLSVYNLLLDDYFLAARQEDEALVREMDAYFSRALAENGTLLHDMYVKPLQSNTTRRFLTRSEMQKLAQSTFSVGYTTDHQPIQFTNDAGKADGIAVEILQLLADEYGFMVDFHGYDPQVPGSRKEYDILLSSQDVIPDLLQKYNPTSVYVELPMVLFVDKEKLADIGEQGAIRTVGIYNYIGFDYGQLSDKYDNPKILRFNSIKDAAASYFRGELDAGIFTLTGAEYITSLVGSDNFRMVATELSLPLRLYISKRLPYEYVETFNLLFDHMDTSQYNLIISKQTTAFTPEFSLYKVVTENKLLLTLIAVSLLCTVLTFIGFGARRKRLAVLDAINHDELTGLSSFYNFTQEAPKLLQKAEENQYQIISIDMDHFSLISKFYGFKAGNQVILAMAEALSAAFSGRTTLVARTVAEQFIILHEYTSLTQIKGVCEEQVIPAIQKIIGEQFGLALSVGVYVIKNPEDRIHDHVDRANAARVKGKSLHKSTLYYFDENMQKRHEREALVVARMEQAIKDKEFVLHYQPKINFDTLQINGAEALVRWPLKDGKFIYPDEFIPVFESNGFIETLDFYVFEHVCMFLAKYSSSVNIPVVSVNLSTFTLRNPATPWRLRMCLEQYQLRPEQVELEITESALIDDANILQEQVDNLKKEGFTVSLDDFGSGVSTLNRLASINVDVVKLDKLFLDFNINEQKGSVVVENVIRLTKELDMKVVCEGVETIEQAQWLKSLNCDLAQGYYFERPLSQEAFLEAVREDKVYKLLDADKVILDI